MSHDIPEVTHYTEGDSLTLRFAVDNLDSDLQVKDLTSSDISWSLRPRSRYFPPELEDSDSGVDITVTSATDGEFNIEIDKEVTRSFRGRNVQEIEIEDSDGDKSTNTGVIIITGVGPEQ